MSGDISLKGAEATLRQDLKDNNVSKFIHDLKADLQNDTFKGNAASLAELKKVAHDELVAKHLMPNVELGDVDDSSIWFKSKKGDDYTIIASPFDGHGEITDASNAYVKVDGDDLVAKPTKEKITADPRNPLESKIERDPDTGKITKVADRDCTYDDQGQLIKLGDWELKEETTGDPPKAIRHWVDSSGAAFPKPPTLDQKTGDVKYQWEDTSFTIKADNSDIGKDKAGNITEVQNPDGTKRTFTWENGKLTQVDYTGPGDNPYKDQWKLEDGNWVNYKPKTAGSDEYVKDETRNPLKNIQVSADGTYTQTNKDDTTRSFKLAGGEGGTETRDVTVDGGTVHWEDGHIAGIDYKDGKKRTFTYDATGKLIESDYEDHSYKDKWVLEGDKGKETWVNYKGDNSTPTKYTKSDDPDNAFKEIGVKPNGDYFEVSHDGKTMTLIHPSGTADAPVDVPAAVTPADTKKDKVDPLADKSEHDVKVNDSTVHWNNGKIESVTDGDGNKRIFKYDGDNLNAVDYIAAGETTPDPDQSWTRKGDHWENGATPPESRKNIGVTKDGDYYEISEDGKTKHTEKTDGSTSDDDVTITPPKKQTVHDQWVAARVQAQKDSEKDVNDNDTHTVKFGDTMWDIARASAKKNSDDHHAPTNREIANEINRLVKNYNDEHPDAKITEPSKVAIGTQIDTSPD